MASLMQVGRILAPWLQQSGLQHALIERQLQARWAAVAGQLVAAHSRPTRLRHGRLTVAVESPAWLHQLSYLQPTLLEQLRRAFGAAAVTDLRLVVGPLEERGAAPPAAPVADAPLSPDVEQAIDEALAPVQDSAIAQIMRRLMAKALSRPHR